MGEQEPRYYPPEIQDLMALKERVGEAIGGVLKRNTTLVYYHSGQAEHVAFIYPQKEKLARIVSPVSAWRDVPHKLTFATYPPSAFWPEREFRIDVNPSYTHPGLRVRAVEPDGTINPGLNQRKILKPALEILNRGLLPWEALGGPSLPQPEAIHNLGLQEIYPVELSQETLEKATKALTHLREERPALFEIVAFDLAVKAGQGLSLELVPPEMFYLEAVTQIFCQNLLLRTLTTPELGTYGKPLLPVFPREFLEEKYNELNKEVEALRRRWKKEALLATAGQVGTSFATALAARMAAERITDFPVPSLVFLGAYCAVFFSSRPHFGKPLREHLFRLTRACLAQRNFEEEWARRGSSTRMH